MLVAAFARVGWGWGGRWTGSPDYQHFSTNGRVDWRGGRCRPATPAPSASSRRGSSTCRSRCRSTAAATLRGVRVAYETYGELSPEREYVVLVCYALSGDAHAAGWSLEGTRSALDGIGADERGVRLENLAGCSR